MEKNKKIIHVYNGPAEGWPGKPPICECGRHKYSIVHIRNGSEVCDARDWACACGAFHHSEEMDQKELMANANYNEWLRKVRQPGYVLTDEDKEILEALEGFKGP